MKRSLRGAVLVLAAGLAGCTNLIMSPTAFTVYDLGRIEDPDVRPALVPAIVDVVAPTWLSSSSMQYRLEYRDAAGREAYAESRWAGHPAEMLQRFVASGVMRNADNAGRCRLRLDLDEFIQTFEGPDESVAEMFVRAALFAPRGEAVLASRSFASRVPAETADAGGGAEAHRRGVREFSMELTTWLDGLASTGESEALKRCRR